MNFILEFFKKRKAKKEAMLKIPMIIQNEIVGTNHSIDDNPVLKTAYDLAKSNNIDESFVKQHLISIIQKYINKFVSDKISDGLLDDNEFNEIINEAQRLSITLTNLSDLERFREYWKIISEPLKPISCELNLTKNEICYFSDSAEWFEFRKVIKRMDYAGVGGRIKIAKGISFKMGSIVPNKVSIDELQHIDSGTIYFTSKKIIFMGTKENKNIPINAILDIEEYKDALNIKKATGKSPLIGLKDPHKANLILSKLF